MINFILISISRVYKKVQAKTQDWSGVLQNFAKGTNMLSPELKNNTAAFCHALKNILKSDKKLGYIN